MHCATENGVDGEEHKKDSFLELTIRCEGFKATAASLDDMIHFQSLIETPSTHQGSTENSKCLSISIETQTLADSRLALNGKNLFRVCLVNEQGERILDTLVQPQVPDVPCKGGSKQALLKYATLKAEKYEVVKERVKSLIKGKSLVAYHLPQKLADLGLTANEIGDLPMYDAAKIFN